MAGWQEILDLTTDLGRRPAPAATRREQAAALGLPSAGALAASADAATFGPRPPQPDQVSAYWQAVMRDPEFVAEAEKLEVDVEQLTGEELTAIIRKTLSLPDAVRLRAEAAFGRKP